MAQVAAQVRDRPRQFDGESLATFGRILATTEGDNKDHLVAIADAISARPAADDERDSNYLAMVTWACVKREVRHPGLFSRAATVLGTRLGSVQTRTLASLAWSQATLQAPDKTFLARLAGELARRGCDDADAFDARSVITLLSLFAQLEKIKPAALTALGRAVRRVLNQLRPRELAVVTWSLASLQHRDPGLFQDLARRCVAAHAAFDNEEASMLLWAVTMLGLEVPELFALMKQQLAGRLNAMDGRQLSMIAWAYARFLAPPQFPGPPSAHSTGALQPCQSAGDADASPAQDQHEMKDFVHSLGLAIAKDILAFDGQALQIVAAALRCNQSLRKLMAAHLTRLERSGKLEGPEGKQVEQSLFAAAFWPEKDQLNTSLVQVKSPPLMFNW